ncbi:MAG: TetR/AcrR family transcriptional regulator [Bacteroidales bacterium]|nr:TetR/AcrR family transcriptional regulator [Bacteroidales bacterium]
MDIKNEQTTEQVILEVAERLFLEKGFALTSTTEIAKEVGCNQALIHYYFRTKENLFNVIFEKKFKMFFQGVFEKQNMGNIQFTDKLKFVIESHFDLLKNNPRIPTLILNELSRQPEQIKILREKLHEIPEQLFAELNTELQTEIANGRIRNISLIDLVTSMISLNVALFVMMPVVEKILPLSETQKEQMIAHRRLENVEFILKSLRP